MTKLLHHIGFVIAVASTTTLAGCDLYFGGHGGHGSGDRWNYCGSDGYYSCTGDNCEWVGATCPTDGGTGGTPTGGACKANTDCAAGCFCQNGTCEEGGFCTTDMDCGTGYHCDTARSSCEPNPPGPACGSNSDCPVGSVCDATTGSCTMTCVCETDAMAVQNGYGYCDETRTTCMSGTDPVGNCAGTVTCNTVMPTCPEHQVPGITNGCYTGMCRDLATCEALPVCGDIQHEDDCLARPTDCGAIYAGQGCKKADGSACHAGDTGCTCDTYTFMQCHSNTGAAQKTFDNGADATQILNNR